MAGAVDSTRSARLKLLIGGDFLGHAGTDVTGRGRQKQHTGPSDISPVCTVYVYERMTIDSN